MFPQPDLTVFVLPNADVIANRAQGSEADRFEGNPREAAAYEAYALEYAKLHPSVIIRPTLATEGRSKINEVLMHAAFDRWIRPGPQHSSKG
jgi:hypothetical protein